MDLALLEDDLNEPGVFEATTMHGPFGETRTAVLCFFNDVIGDLVASGRLVECYLLRSEIGANPVYSYETGSGTVLVLHPGVGAPLAAGFCEEAAALGVTTFVACGGAGALVDDLALGHVMVVNAAVRDEGTSFHYLAPSRVVEADPVGVDVLSRVLEREGVDYFVGRTWTTDALFRETRSRVNRRVEEGCSMVDMEASAFMAVARYRNLRFAQLLYAGDTLAGATWDRRHWERDTSVRERLFEIAAIAAVELAAV